MVAMLLTASLAPPCSAADGVAANAAARHYQTKTPYAPQQAIGSYEAVPDGYRAVYTEMLARHGSRGLTAMKADLALYNLWLQAKREQQLTALGSALGPDILKMMRANFLLGYGVAGISKPGYGNETMQGIAEHRQLARRLHQRLPQLFRDGGATSGGAPRQIVVLTSGKDRAVDSGAFFIDSLLAEQADLAPRIVYPPSLAPRAEQHHDSRPAGTDRFLLYFHKLSSKQDQVADATDPLYQTFRASQAYQRWLGGDEWRARRQAILDQPRLRQAARTALARLFTPAFIAGIDDGRYRAANSGSFTFASDDGKFSNTLSGDGQSRIESSTEAALMLYELYGAAAGMQAELKSDFTRYLQPAQAAVFAETEDALGFYGKGPGTREGGDINYKMAQTLLDDFFGEIDAIAAGNLAHLAKLRFAHAETVIPLAALLGLESMSTPLPRALLYSYQNSAWRGADVAPMAANIQWDVFGNSGGELIVRMLYNERERAFKPACDSARIRPGSHFYIYRRLKECYR